MNDIFKLQDRIYQLGFSFGVSPDKRQRRIEQFVGRWKNDPRLEKWIDYLEQVNDELIPNKGGYLRTVMEQFYDPPTKQYLYGKTKTDL